MEPGSRRNQAVAFDLPAVQLDGQDTSGNGVLFDTQLCHFLLGDHHIAQDSVDILGGLISFKIYVIAVNKIRNPFSVGPVIHTFSNVVSFSRVHQTASMTPSLLTYDLDVFCITVLLRTSPV